MKILIVVLLAAFVSNAFAKTSLYLEPMYEVSIRDTFYLVGLEYEKQISNDVKYIGFAGPYFSGESNAQKDQDRWAMTRHAVQWKASDRILVEPTYWLKLQDTGFRQDFVHLKVVIELAK